MAMQFYVSPEQNMRDRSEFARKGIARGRSVIVLSFPGGVLFVAENISTALHKVSEIYDRVGFAAVGRYNEYENLRAAGVRLADLHGYSYDRRDVTGRQIAHFYARMLGAVFTEQPKPFEVEIGVAQVGRSQTDDELYRITYDGTVRDEPDFLAMGGQAEAISTAVRSKLRPDLTLAAALRLAIAALSSVDGENGQPRTLAPAQLEIAVLDRSRVGRTFRRITGLALAKLLESASAEEETAVDPPQPPAAPGTPADNASGKTPAPESDAPPVEETDTSAPVETDPPVKTDPPVETDPPVQTDEA